MRLIFSVLFVFFSCKNIEVKKDSKTQNKLLTIEEWNRESKKIISEVNLIKNSENLEPNGGKSYYKKNVKYFIEVLEDMKTNKKEIDYSYKFNDSVFRHFKNYSFFLNQEKKIILLTSEKYDYDKKTQNEVNKNKDTFLLKSNKIVFWKNNLNPSIEELNSKEDEIIKIRIELDEYIK